MSKHLNTYKGHFIKNVHSLVIHQHKHTHSHKPKERQRDRQMEATGLREQVGLELALKRCHSCGKPYIIRQFVPESGPTKTENTFIRVTSDHWYS